MLTGATGVTLTLPDALLVPAALVAVTLHEYCTSFVRLVTEIGLTAPVPVRVV